MKNFIGQMLKIFAFKTSFTGKLDSTTLEKLKKQSEDLDRQRTQLVSAYEDLDRHRTQLDAAYEDLDRAFQGLDSDADELPKEIRNFINEIIKNKLSMTSKLNLTNTAIACKNILENRIKGDFVECGVWRGGHSILAAFIFDFYKSDRKIYLYDTFEGMTAASKKDVRIFDKTLAEELFKIDEESLCDCSLEHVETNFEIMNVSTKNVKFVKGDVCLTLQEEHCLPEQISVLRLDTDLYDSTKIELHKLYDLVQAGGPIIFDDYGYWAGQRLACDEYFKHLNINPYLVSIGGGSRLMVKSS